MVAEEHVSQEAVIQAERVEGEKERATKKGLHSGRERERERERERNKQKENVRERETNRKRM